MYIAALAGVLSENVPMCQCANEYVHTSQSLLYITHVTDSKQVIFQVKFNTLTLQNTTSSLLHAILPITWIYTTTMYILTTVAKSHTLSVRESITDRMPSFFEFDVLDF